MKTFLPGATIGLMGGGQLGRMFALAARKMGYRVHTFDPTQDSPSGQISEREFNFSYEDTAALKEFAASVDVVTYEFENIPAVALDVLAGQVTLRPNRDSLYISQNRRREKEFLQQHGFPVAPFRVVTGPVELAAAVAAVGTPCVLKTADFGYDGKGQQKIEAGTDLTAVWARHGVGAGVVEKWIEFESEVSVIAARGVDGMVRTFPLARNVHTHHILDISTVPAEMPQGVETAAAAIATALIQKLDIIGLLAVEFFVTAGGELLVNETAPRPHNSGHYTFDACLTSQFEQQLRAVCGLPLGDPQLLRPVLMRNVLGDVWGEGAPPWDKLLGLPGLKLHLYGKSEPRPGRKMGHYCVLADSLAAAWAVDAEAQKILRR